MGRPKGLLPVGPPGEERPWILDQIARARTVGIPRFIVVLGFDEAEYLPILAEQKDVQVVKNPEPSRGSFSSLQCGLATVPESGIFVLPIDVPVSSRETWATLALAVSLDADALAAVPGYAGRGGHPVLLARPFFPILRELDDKSPLARLDRQLALAGDRVRRVAVSDVCVTKNLNDPLTFRRHVHDGEE